ncbi:hypothetical protein LINPERPRIM_LOCUS42472 [Linum perenne]
MSFFHSPIALLMSSSIDLINFFKKPSRLRLVKSFQTSNEVLNSKF